MFQKKNVITLTELLVVIATVIFLMAIVTPPLVRARQYSKLMFCSANLKTMGKAMNLHLADNDDKYPECFTSMFNGNYTGYGYTIPINCQWHDKRISPEINPEFAGPLWHYIENMSVFLCPTGAEYGKIRGADHPGHNLALPIEPQYSYSQNVFLGLLMSNGQPLGVLKQSEVVNPDKVVVFVEETLWIIHGLADYVLTDTTFFPRHMNDFSFGDSIATFHKTTLQRPNDGMGNAVFVDGHVELCDPWDSTQIEGGQVTASFRLAWPKGNALSTQMPY